MKLDFFPRHLLGGKKTGGRPMGKMHSIPRREPRVPMEVAVYLSGHREKPGVETTFTENISSRGARVVTARAWQANESLMLASLPGNFQALARVAYCEPRLISGFAVGLEFVEPTGNWILPRPVGNNQQKIA